MYMHSFHGGATLLRLGLILLLYTFVWWRDVIRESTLEGHHTKVVQFKDLDMVFFFLSYRRFCSFSLFFGLLLILLWHLRSQSVVFGPQMGLGL